MALCPGGAYCNGAVSRGAYCNGRCVQEVHTVMALCPGGAYCNGAVSRRCIL